MIIIPAIDLQGGRVVRSSPGAAQPEALYSDDPVGVAHRWARAGAQWLHVIDLDGILAGRPVQLGLVRAITTAGVPVQVGGGFRSLSDLEAGLRSGAARVLLDPVGLPAAGEAIRRLGGRVAALLRVGAEAPGTDHEALSADPILLGKALVASGIHRIVYNDAAHEGTLGGPDLRAVEAFVRAVPVPVIVAGGVAAEKDLMALQRIGVEGVILGRALYEGRLTFRSLNIPPADT